MEDMPRFPHKKKLLFVITKSEWGGAGRYVFDLATSLSGTYDVSVILGLSGQGKKGTLAEKLEGRGIRTIAIPTLGRDLSAKGDRAAFFSLLKTFRDEKPDIVHLNSSKAGGLGALAARLARVPRIVYTAHGWAFNEPVPALSRMFRWAASLATGLLCHHVITVSRFDEMHSPFGIEVTTIHNGIEAPAFLVKAAARARIAARAGVPEDTFIIGTIAELHENKGLDILIEAFAGTSKGHLVIIGEGEERPALEALVKKLGIGERVHLVGFIGDAATLLPAFDIFALTSRKEGLPYVLLEAGFAEVPVIASMVGGIPEIVDDQLSGILVPAYDSQAAAEALESLTGSPGTRVHYASRLKEKVERYFPLAGMVKKTVEVYES